MSESLDGLRCSRCRTVHRQSLSLLFLTFIFSLPILLGSVSASTNSKNALKKLPRKAWIQTRRLLNFNSLFGTVTKNAATPYDRVAGHPVFAVTTPWGSPYLNMEKLSDLDEVVPPEGSTGRGGGGKTPQSLSEEQNEVRTVALYFMDPDDALGVHSEMKQIEQMENTDMRLTCFSLAKALRQASNLGHGLVTGVPANALDGNIPYDQGGALRYKIVPPKRQLYYAARCIGKERVGLFSESPNDDAQAAVMGNSALEGLNLVRRREKRERKSVGGKRTAMQQKNAHMEGYTGIPVFYNPQMKRVLPLIKRIMTGSKHEIPLYFNYEDMVDAWQRVRTKYKHQKLPEVPDNVEVFNLWDVLTSMDREANGRKRLKQTKKDWLDQFLLEPVQSRVFGPSYSPPGLQEITFVPSSRSVSYKEAVSARGNGKARLRPMR